MDGVSEIAPFEPFRRRWESAGTRRFAGLPGRRGAWLTCRARTRCGERISKAVDFGGERLQTPVPIATLPLILRASIRMGVYVLAFGGHVATVRDGVLLDSWDSSDLIPVYYYAKED